MYPTVDCALKVSVTGDVLRVHLSDGRRLAVPTAWYPRLAHGTPRERSHWRLIGQGAGIHWPDLDEDISVEGLLAGPIDQSSLAKIWSRSIEQHAW